MLLALMLDDFFFSSVADELLLPHMKRVDGMITDNRKRLLHKLHMEQVLKVSMQIKLYVKCTFVFLICGR